MDCCSSSRTIPERKRRTVSQIKLKRGSALVFQLKRCKMWQQGGTVLVPRIKRRTILQGLAGTAAALALHGCLPG